MDIKLYRARIGLFNKRQRKLPVNSYDINIVRIAHTWFFGITVAVMLMIGGVELNPGLQTEELIEFMLEQTEEMKGICE